MLVPELKERELTNEPFGQLLLVSSLIADFVSIFLISFYVLLRSHGLTAEVMLFLVLLAAFAAVYRTAGLFQRQLLTDRFFDRLSSATSQIELRGSLVLALIFIVLAETLGTENILGAFLAGVIVSMLSRGEGSILRQKLDAIGLKLGAVSEPLYAAIILVGIITCTFSPMIFNALLSAYTPKRDRVVVIVCKNTIQLLIDRLKQHEFHTISFCRNESRNKKQTAEGIPSIKIQDTISDEMRNAALEKALAVVAIEEKDEDNLRLCRMARKMFGVENIIAWVQDPIRNREFRQVGARVVNPAYSSLLIIEGMLLNPDAFSMTADVDQSVEMREIKLKESNVVGLSVSSLNIPEGVTVLMIQRKGDFLTPANETVLQANDVITLAGHSEDLARALDTIRKKK